MASSDLIRDPDCTLSGSVAGATSWRLARRFHRLSISRGTSPPRSRVRDVALFQLKLLLDTARDPILSPASPGAVLLDFILSKYQSPRCFHAVLRQGERSEEWIDLWSAGRSAQSRERMSFDTFSSAGLRVSWPRRACRILRMRFLAMHSRRRVFRHQGRTPGVQRREAADHLPECAR